jgi:hypothetical protein
VTLEEMEAQIISLRERVLHIQEEQESQRKDRLQWSRVCAAVGGALLMIAGFAAIFLPRSPMSAVLVLLALFATFESRIWFGRKFE